MCLRAISAALLFSYLIRAWPIGVIAQTGTALTCESETPESEVVQLCTGSGTLAVGQQDLYTLDIAADTGATVYEGFDVDIDARLSSVTGNVDLQVVKPSGSSFFSTRNVGDDIVFINKNELESGTYTFSVTGVALTTNYILMVYITYERELNPIEQVVVGQIMLTCCNQDPHSCSGLKQTYPTLADNDNSTNPNYCYIHGNVCARDGHMQELSMPSNSMSCVLPARALQSLTRLERIDLSNNSITGNLSDISSTLAAAANLEYVDMSGNKVWGALHQACDLTKRGGLKQLALAANNITGSIPACILGIRDLAELQLSSNALAGTIPNFANPKSSKLVYFRAANQTSKGGGFNGSLPSLIGDLSRLAYLDLSGNMLTGDLPSLPSNVREVSFSNNELTNSGYAEAIPHIYGSLAQLTKLTVQNNSLSGFLPAEVAAAPGLLYLDISTNTLSGTLPPDWTNLNLQYLKMDHNYLTGTVPGALGDLQQLLLLDLSSNLFSGTLDDFASETADNRNDINSIMRYFSVANNTLSGPLTDVDGLGDLGVFTQQASQMATSGLPGASLPLTMDLSSNSFIGVWPRWLFDAIYGAPQKVKLNLTGSVLTCPPEGFAVTKPVPAGYLDGLACQSTSADGSIVQTPLSQVVQVADDDLSGGAVFGIVIAVLLGLAAVGGIAWYWWKRNQHQKASAAAAFGNAFAGFGNYPPQGRGAGYSSFSDDHQTWAEHSSTPVSPTPGASPLNKQKAVGLASMPLSQRGDF